MPDDKKYHYCSYLMMVQAACDTADGMEVTEPCGKPAQVDSKLLGLKRCKTHADRLPYWPTDFEEVGGEG